MKAPLDPSEPMFPIRPNEPLCQYFMKHGTCKFGQTCKFHHPPQSPLGGPTAVMNGNAVVLSVARKNDTPQMVWNPAGGDVGVQLLPQRPDEPNCIFFLKNGRCKYGSTCRYHHPLNFHERQRDDGRRQHTRIQQVSGDAMHAPKIHYVTSLPSNAYQHGHFVVTDGAVTFVSLDGSSPAQVISVPHSNSAGGDPGGAYAVSGSSAMGGAPLGLSRDVGSSSSSTSIASSFDTATSNADPLGSHSDGVSLWNSRPNRTGSGNSLNAYNIVEPNGHGRAHMVPHGNRTILIQTSGDGSITLPRVASTGSASENGTVYYDASNGLTRAPNSQIPQANGGSNPVAWRGRRSGSFDHTRSSSSSGHLALNGELPKSSSVHEGLGDEDRVNGARRSPMMGGRPPVSGQRSQRRSEHRAEVDDGLSMMTSALLTMLDTPEEGPGSFDGLDYNDHQESASQPSTPRMRPQYPSSDDSGLPPDPRGSSMYYQPGLHYMPGQSYSDMRESHDNEGLGRVIPGQRDSSSSAYVHNGQNNLQDGQRHLKAEPNSWSPTWHGAGAHNIGNPMQENAQSMSVMQSQSSSNSPHGPSNVGLYLP